MTGTGTKDIPHLHIMKLYHDMASRLTTEKPSGWNDSSR